jgi:hypothetical protein
MRGRDRTEISESSRYQLISFELPPRPSKQRVLFHGSRVLAPALGLEP